jgi:hypothetical protein
MRRLRRVAGGRRDLGLKSAVEHGVADLRVNSIVRRGVAYRRLKSTVERGVADLRINSVVRRGVADRRVGRAAFGRPGCAILGNRWAAACEYTGAEQEPSKRLSHVLLPSHQNWPETPAAPGANCGIHCTDPVRTTAPGPARRSTTMAPTAAVAPAANATPARVSSV